MSRILDGRGAAKQIRAEIASEVAAMRAAGIEPPCLAAVLVGDNPASSIYVSNKVKACTQAGIIPREIRLPSTTTQMELLALVRELSRSGDVDGILVQMPLPAGIDPRAIIAAIDPARDVDGFHPINVGRLWSGEEGLVPCTPLGILEMLDSAEIEIEGAEAVIIGRSDIVGKPTAALLLRKHATVTLCHSRTRDLAGVAARADILVAAIGRAAFVTRDFIKPGATVIDVGINQVVDVAVARGLFGDEPGRLEEVRTKGYTLVGDVHPRDAAERSGAWTPVPGGVGPLTVALLLRNTVKAAKARRGSPGRRGPGA
ncbi:MAG TPA: bifunctional 5,10-methylenetetrahydrofolate dehydrogenase/5,10-methenyltetrahydrofolate cyclohydrolase [Candidatus Polarisedimenticolia bacterium]